MSRLIEIRLTKCRLFLTEPELIGLLARDPELWKQVIRRGKAVARARRERRRANDVTGPAGGRLHRGGRGNLAVHKTEKCMFVYRFYSTYPRKKGW